MQTTEQAPALNQALDGPYRHGFVTDIESDVLPPGLDEDTARLTTRSGREDCSRHLAQETRARFFTAVASESFGLVADAGAAPVDLIAHQPDRLSGLVLLLGTQVAEERAQEPGRGGPQVAGNL